MDDDDPLWYDRAEADTQPHPIVNAIAYLFLLVLAGFVAVLQLYWLPDRLWCSAWRWIRRYRATRAERL